METKLKLSYTKSALNENALPVIIVAGGSSSRMEGIDKKFLMLAEEPLIVRTIRRFENSENISRIIVVTKKEDILKIEQLCEEYMLSKVSDIIEGGQNRQESVKNGIKMLTEENVLIHDGARPFVTERIISECALSLKSNTAVLTALKINDTVKRVNDNGFVEETLERNFLYSAQTPQGVNVPLYKKALQKIEDLSLYTDDSSIMESINEKVFIVKGSAENIKITTKNDIILANAIIKGEEQCE